MKRNVLAGLLTAGALSVLGLVPSALGQGSLTPPGAPSPTMKSLVQIEPRTAITNTGAVTLSQAGTYYLTGNLSVSSGHAITIGGSGVTLDLNGFTISSSASPNDGAGILLLVGASDITIRNGHIQGGVTFNAGTYSGPGFQWGIYNAGVAANILVKDVSVAGCSLIGIYAQGVNSSIESCRVSTVSGNGIQADNASHCTLYRCGSGMQLTGVASDCYSSAGGSIVAATANNCYCQSAGNGVYATTANNCYGLSSAGSGISASNANNCIGFSTSSSGVHATTANNCTGQSSSGIGLSADIAINSTGSSTGGTGLLVTSSGNACSGRSSNGTGLYAANLAVGCYGSSLTSTGLVAWIGNSCWGSGAPALSINNKYNSP